MSEVHAVVLVVVKAAVGTGFRRTDGRETGAHGEDAGAGTIAGRRIVEDEILPGVIITQADCGHGHQSLQRHAGCELGCGDVQEVAAVVDVLDEIAALAV